MISQVVIVGSGIAGFLAAVAIKRRLPELSITIIRGDVPGGMGSETIPPSVLEYLHRTVGLSLGELMSDTRAVWSLGTRMVWGSRPYFDRTFAPQVSVQSDTLARPHGFYVGDDFTDANQASALMSADRVFLADAANLPQERGPFGYQVQVDWFVSYLDWLTPRLGIQVLHDSVVQVTRSGLGVEQLSLESGQVLFGHLFVDASGYQPVLLNEPWLSYRDHLCCNQTVFGRFRRADQSLHPYSTIHTATSGWLWQLEHRLHVSCGYVYGSEYLSQEEAAATLVQEFPGLEDLDSVSFPQGRRERAWVGNVVAIGETSGFVEPLASAFLPIVAEQCRTLTEILVESRLRPTPTFIHHYNRYSAQLWDQSRDLLSVYYKYNTQLATPFWQRCRSRKLLETTERIVTFYRENGPVIPTHHALLQFRDIVELEDYFHLFVGIGLPVEIPYQRIDAEIHLWNKLRQEYRERAQTGLTPEQAFEVVKAL